MSFAKKLAIGAAVSVASTNAAACALDEYETWFTQFMQGFQEDTANYDNDCFESATSFTVQTHEMFDSFRNFKVDDWLEPVYMFQNDLVELTGVFSNCQTTNAAK